MGFNKIARSAAYPVIAQPTSRWRPSHGPALFYADTLHAHLPPSSCLSLRKGDGWRLMAQKMQAKSED